MALPGGSRPAGEAVPVPTQEVAVPHRRPRAAAQRPRSTRSVRPADRAHAAAVPRPAPGAQERGATTAEYAVGTLGAATCATVLLHLGTDGWFLDRVVEVLQQALDPRTLPELLRHGRPFTPLR